MSKEMKIMKPIWYFVGLMLMTIGGIILITGLYHLFTPRASAKVLAELYPDIWWGGIMLLVGVVFFVLSLRAVAKQTKADR